MVASHGKPIGGLPKLPPYPMSPPGTPSAGAGLVDGDYGDITVSGGGTVMTIDPTVVSTTSIIDDSVTNAKLANMPTLTMKGNDTGGTADPKDLTVAEVLTLLDLDSIADLPITQPSASTSWTIIHGRSVKPNFSFYNDTNGREYPLENHNTPGQVTVTFATAVVHTATLPGNGTSASIRNDSIISYTATQINTASGVIDIVTAKTVIITMDVDLTSDITFSTTPTDKTPLRLAFIKTATPHTATLASSKFKGSTTNIIPVPLLLATASTEDTFDFLFSATKGKMCLTGYDLGA